MTGWFASAAHADNGLLLVCNKGDHALAIFNPDTGAPLAVIEENGVAHPGTDGQLIRLIDLEKHAVVGTVDFGKGVRPHCAVIGPKNKLLYVTAELENAIEVIDPKTFKILYSVPTGQDESHMLIIASNGRYGYTANVGPGTVSASSFNNGNVVMRKIFNGRQ